MELAHLVITIFLCSLDEGFTPLLCVSRLLSLPPAQEKLREF